MYDFYGETDEEMKKRAEEAIAEQVEKFTEELEDLMKSNPDTEKLTVFYSWSLQKMAALQVSVVVLAQEINNLKSLLHRPIWGGEK